MEAKQELELREYITDVSVVSQSSRWSSTIEDEVQQLDYQFGVLEEDIRLLKATINIEELNNEERLW